MSLEALGKDANWRGEHKCGVLPLAKFLPCLWALQCKELSAASGPKALAPV